MPGFLYFLPGLQAVNRARVEAAGLGYLFEKQGGANTRGAQDGPGGVAGAYFSVPGKGGRGESDLQRVEAATWTPIPGSPASLGVLADALPGPDDLARAELVDGHAVELADGKPWTIPVVRKLLGGSALPRALAWDGKDWSRGEVLPVYRKLYAAGQRLFDAFRGSEGDGPTTLTEEVETAVTAIAVNYRVGPAEVSALGLLNTRSAGEVLRAMIDIPALEQLRGKAEAAGPSSRPGGAVS